MYVCMDTVCCLESTWQHNKPNGHRLHELGVEHSKSYICWIDNDVCYVRFVMFHHKYLCVLSELCSGVLW